MMKMTSEQLYTYVTLLDNLDVLIKLDQSERKKAAEENSNDFFAGMDDTRYTARLHEIADELDSFRKEHSEELDGLCETLGAYRKEDGCWYIKRRKLMINGDEATAFFFNVEEEFNLDAELRKMEF